MKPIAILETGRPPAELAATHGDYPAMLARLLGPEVSVEVFDVQAGRLPGDLDRFSGAMVTGSPAGVYEDLPWMPGLLHWLRQARGQLPLVGICFGHQAMAQAFGGHVEKARVGWGVGLHRYDIVAAEPWMDPAADSIAIPVSHQDQVVRIPAEARVFARSDFTPHAGLAWGEDAISFQGHPEFEPAYASALVQARRGSAVAADLVDRAVATLREPNSRDLVAGWVRTFFGVDDPQVAQGPDA